MQEHPAAYLALPSRQRETGTAIHALTWAVLLGLGVRPAYAAIPASDADAGADAGADIATAAVEEITATAFSVLEFDQGMLQFPIDTSLFAMGNAVPAGNYRVDLYTNQDWKGRVSVRFAMPEDQDRIAQPCFDLALLELLGLDLDQLEAGILDALKRGESVCRPLGELFEGASTQYDSGELKLTIHAPQVLLRREARGYVDPEVWDHGVTAGMLDYSYNGYRSRNRALGSNTSHYASLRAGLNMGPWRLRYSAAVNKTDATGTHYRGHSATLERGLVKLKSRLVLGDTVTDGRVFDSVRFRGVRMDSDERMLSDSQRGFAPVVRGIAQTNAMVSITQLGQEIYQTNVPPGAFVIDDLYPTGASGDLTVTITESDGSVHEFIVAYAGSAELVRPGTYQYTLAAGQHESGAMDNAPKFVMGHVRRGISNRMTGYAGVMVAEGYTAVSGGLAFNLAAGAVATDFTFATTHTAIGNFRGSSARVTWAKNLSRSGTNVTLASYRYSSQGYYDPSAAFSLRDRAARGSGIPGGFGLLGVQKTKNRLVANISQRLPGNWGNLNLSASSQDYWARDGRDTQYQAGMSRRIGRMNVGLSASRMHNVFRRRWDNQYMLTLSMPLGGIYTNSSYSHREDSQALNISASGTAGQHSQFGFGAFVNATASDYSGAATQYSGGANASWNASKAQMSVNLSSSRYGSRQYGVNVSGGVVAFGGGIVLSRRLGDTIAIVRAKDAAGARVSGQGGGVRLNRKGLAVVSNMQAYRQNRVNLDPQGLSTDIALAYTARQVAPTAGAVALLEYETERGYSLLLNGRHSDGSKLPFAAAVTDEEGRNVGHVAQGGQALIRVKAVQGTLRVRWGSGVDQTCQFSYTVPDDKRSRRGKDPADHGFQRVEAVCAGDSMASIQP